MNTSENANEKIGRAQGSLLGLAVCDALGTTLEFCRPGTFEPVSDIVGGGPFDLKPGQWTDDTSMALCLAESLAERQRFDAADQMQRYLRWFRDGVLSSTGRCFDIGRTTADALRSFERTGNPFSGPVSPQTAGNGSIMRLAPVPVFFAEEPSDALHYSGESSRTTHGAPEAVDACRYFGGLIVGAMNGVSKQELLSAQYSPVEGFWQRSPLAPGIGSVADGSFKTKQPPAIRGTGYVVDSLEAALWAFYHSGDFKTGALLSVNLGEDADTTGAVYGQLAGAYYGRDAIPAQWLQKVWYREKIEQLAAALAGRPEGEPR